MQAQAKLFLTKEDFDSVLQASALGNKIVLDKPYGSLRFSSYRLDKSLAYNRAKVCVNQELHISIDYQPLKPSISLHFFNKGRCIKFVQGWAEPKVFLEGQFFISYAPIPIGYTEFEGNQEICFEGNGIDIDLETFIQFVEVDPRKDVRELFSPMLISPDKPFGLLGKMSKQLIASLKQLNLEASFGLLNVYQKQSILYGVVHEALNCIINQRIGRPTIKLDFQEVCKLKKAKFILDENLSKNFSLSELSQRVGLSEAKLIKGFKQLNGESVIAYFNRQKIEEAAKLLKTTDLSIIDVAALVGFTSPAYFTAEFKKRFGVTPSRFRGA